jgi:predicted permease
MPSFTNDFAFAFRSLRRAPGFSLAAILMLGVAIGLATAVLSAAYGILLRPLDLPDPERLYSVAQNMEKRGGSREDLTGFGLFSDWRARSTSFEGMAAYTTFTADIADLDPPENFAGAWVSHEFFPVLGIRPALGRSFLEEEEAKGRRGVVILSHRLWVSRFGSEPSILGRKIRLNGEPHVVVGVLPRGFRPPVLPDAEIWVPAPLEPPPNDRGYSYVYALGRLKSGVSPRAAKAEMDRLADRLAQEYPDRLHGVGVTLIPLREAITGRARTPLVLLLGAVSLVLLVGCVNVGNLVLTRAASRQAELALRLALGASRSRIARLFVVEGLLLAVAGATAGLLLGFLAVAYLRGLASPQTPRLDSIGLNGAALAASFAVSLAATLATGLLPLVRSLGNRTFEALREGGGITSGRTALLARGFLVAAEVAASIVLLAGAGVFLRTLNALDRVDPGFEIQKTVVGDLLLPFSFYPEDRDVAVFQRRFEERLAQRPEIAAAGLVTPPPLTGGAFEAQLLFEGESAAEKDPPTARLRVATPGFFATAGLPLRTGRFFMASDALPGAPPVLVVSEAFVRRYFAKEEHPLGRRLRLPDTGGFGPEAPWSTIVGVAADFRGLALDQPPEPELFIPMAQGPALRELSVVARARGTSAAALRALQDVANEVHPGQVVSHRMAMVEIVDRSLAPRRFGAGLTATFAAAALTLAAIGIYGVAALAASQRRREIAVRLALGAAPSMITRMILRWSGRLVACGVVAGLAGSFAMRKTMAGFLYGVQPMDGPTVGGVVFIVVLIAFVATLPPALRAGRTAVAQTLKDGK